MKELNNERRVKNAINRRVGRVYYIYTQNYLIKIISDISKCLQHVIKQKEYLTKY